MKMFYKLFGILMIAMANAAVASAQSVFSVEKITEAEFIKAQKEYSRYNVSRADSIPHNGIVDKIFKEAKSKFEQSDPDQGREMYEFNNEEFGSEMKRLSYYPEFKLYGFIPGMPFDDYIWWFDSESGKYLCSQYSPIAMNVNGMYVAQMGYDCDWKLDLKFCCRKNDYFYESQSYKNSQYNGETVIYKEDGTGFPRIFWYGDNVLFLKTYDIMLEKYTYLKITANFSVEESGESSHFGGKG